MNAVVAFALNQRVLMVALMLFVFAAGFIGFTKLNIEAYPDPVPPLVEIITQAPGQAAEEIERYFTIPLEIQMEGIPNVTAIRTISLFGLSDVRIFFNYNFTYEQADHQHALLEREGDDGVHRRYSGAWRLSRGRRRGR